MRHSQKEYFKSLAYVALGIGTLAICVAAFLTCMLIFPPVGFLLTPFASFLIVSAGLSWLPFISGWNYYQKSKHLANLELEASSPPSETSHPSTSAFLRKNLNVTIHTTHQPILRKSSDTIHSIPRQHDIAPFPSLSLSSLWNRMFNPSKINPSFEKSRLALSLK